jgi:CubicO group peptidase (beta-lactamase class C family)
MEMSPAARTISVGALLNHSSGLPRQPNDERMFLSLLRYTFTGDNIYGHIDKARVSRFLADFVPDEGDIGHYRYSNLGSGLLARALEVKFGKPFYDQLSENLLKKIGAWDTVMDLDPSRAARLADAHVGDSPLFVTRGTRIGQWKMSDILRGAAGLYSTADDLVELLRYRMAIDTIPTVRLPVQGHIFSVRRNLYQDSSYGWQVDFIVPDEFQIIFQHGMISGYTAYVGFIPDKKIGVVVLTNSFNWDDHIGHNMLVGLSRRSKAGHSLPAP